MQDSLGITVKMQNNQMKAMWNQRAQKDAFYYVESAFWDGELDSFFLLGEERTQSIIDPVIHEFNISTSSLNVLEIGCGVGRFSRALAKRFKNVFAVDVSEEMIKQAQELHPTQVYPNLYFEATDGNSLSAIETNSIDFAFSYEVFQHMPSQEIVLNNLQDLHRVLRADGIAMIHLMTDHLIWQKTIKKRLKSLIPSSVWQAMGVAPLKFDSTWTGTSLSHATIQKLCQQANLQIVKMIDDFTHSSGDRIFLIASPQKNVSI